jgi:cellulose synthase/poly-beta-1,6-N-acetylglucosamine synthase-like glycosyltransferase
LNPRKEPLKTPAVEILIAAYNEESVIEDKIKSILTTDYPLDKIRITVGSDGSDDQTEAIIKGMSHPEVDIAVLSYDRSGKTSVVNHLVSQSTSDLIILTDANVMFCKGTIAALVAPFEQAEIGLVGADIRPEAEHFEGIAHQESEYLQRENRMKYKEGAKWGTMMGAFGGCYAMRRALFRPVPKHFLVDDFHITMSVLEQGYDAILEPEAVCLEDVSSKLSEEFRRKVRMSTGNFQNLRAFAPLLFSNRKGLSFAFISHKVFRWLTPIFILTSLFASFMLRGDSLFFYWAFYFIAIACATPLIDLSLKSMGFQSKYLRFLTYFVSMNFALLVGMVRSFRKIERATWQPTERNQ